ncbi:MAG: polysaccharide deacetylase family protein [Myxococcales bacterium]|nr:polysaccharide deacetylase family protein [Myxococcales bacterium]
MRRSLLTFFLAPFLALLVVRGSVRAHELALVGAVVPTTVVAPEPAEATPPHDPLAAELAGGRTTRGFVRHRMLHFTFDDGPRLDTTPRLLDALDAHGVKATFFVVARGFDGNNATDRAKAALLREVARRGHTIGAHTYDHANLTRLDDEGIRAQLDAQEAVFEAVLGGRPWLFRPPYGARDERTDALLVERGYTQMLWNVTARDVESRTGEQVAEAFAQSLDLRERHPRGPGGIVVLHDTKPWVVDAFPAMMAELERRNCALLASGEELWDVLDEPSIFHEATGDRPRMQREADVDDAFVAARQEVLRARLATRCGG